MYHYPDGLVRQRFFGLKPTPVLVRGVRTPNCVSPLYLKTKALGFTRHLYNLSFLFALATLVGGFWESGGGATRSRRYEKHRWVVGSVKVHDWQGGICTCTIGSILSPVLM